METKNSNSLAAMKLLCAFFVVVLHALSHGNTLDNVEVRTTDYYAYWILESLAYVAVNVFILSSGYFQLDKKFRMTKVISLVFQVLFYSSVSFVVYTAATQNLSLGDLYRTFFPISSEIYGFATTYIAVYMMSPLINRFVLSLSGQQRSMIICIIVICFSVYPTVKINTDYLGLNYGASFLWYGCLYFIGACIRQTKLKEVRPWVWLAAYVGFCFAGAAAGFAAREIAMFMGLSLRGEGVLLYYNSCTVLSASVCFFLFFASLDRVSAGAGRNSQKIFRMVTSTTLGVYLLHDNYLLRSYIWTPIQNNWGFGVVLGYAVALFVVCVLFDIQRMWLFRILQLDRLSSWFAGKITGFFFFCRDKLDFWLNV